MSLENSPSFFVDLSEVVMPDKYKRKSFRLDIVERRLFRNGTPGQLTPKAFDVLAALVERSGRLVEKDELLHLVWSDSFVEESNISRIIHTLRRELRENDHGHKFIETVAKKGYRFVAKAKEVNEPLPPTVSRVGLK